MARRGGNPDLHKAAKKAGTQFKKGDRKSADSGVKPYSYRHQLQYIAGQPIDLSSPEALEKSIKALTEGVVVTAARAVAIRMLERVLKKMDPALAVGLIEQTEGKLSQEIKLNPPKESPTEFATLEEASAFYNSDINQ